ncbi:ABC transporter ATP-binding protein [Salicibibacter cibarius]|uniref:ABC transporter ATP-binding protein n=1 Tax=Salicibibacter cibarius TaxID=2743000 RepID=A0A7T6Z2N7_9BACI|nr:ABC transporter ATP-binding protein [Salicibibacter cibarius]QQK75883.1 ABC transporter ATP-binding protein [Salicibibacter cibarius]
METNEPVMQVKNVSKVLGEKRAVNNVNFDLYPGEVFGLLGPNGAGKTTAIRMMVGLISMTEGQVLIKGASIDKDFEEAISHVGAIVENPEMYDYLTGHQNLLHYARMAGDVSEKRMYEIIELVGLENTIDNKVKTYSLGMRQRLGLAQALVHSPALLILDEPTNGLDPEGIREFRQHLKKLTQEEGMAVLVSSHLLAEMELMCDRVGIIHHGKLLTVQSIHDFGEPEKDLVVSMTVDRVDIADQAFKHTFPKHSCEVQEKTIDVRIDDEQIPQVIKCFVENDVNIYRVRTKAKTLEDTFLEWTGGQQIV